MKSTDKKSLWLGNAGVRVARICPRSPCFRWVLPFVLRTPCFLGRGQAREQLLGSNSGIAHGQGGQERELLAVRVRDWPRGIGMPPLQLKTFTTILGRKSTLGATVCPHKENLGDSPPSQCTHVCLTCEPACPRKLLAPASGKMDSVSGKLHQSWKGISCFFTTPSTCSVTTTLRVHCGLFFQSSLSQLYLGNYVT